MKTDYKYTVTLDNENNDEWVYLYSGTDLAEAEKTYDEYKFIEGDQRLQLDRYGMTWRYEGQKTPDIDAVPNILKERYQ